MFPNQVNTLQAPGVAGDFASTNPRAFVDAGQYGLVAGAAGLTVARFAWRDPWSYNTVSNTGIGAPTGFVFRNQQGLNTTGPGLSYVDGTQFIPAGFGVTLMNAGDVFVVNSGTTEAVPGQVAYAAYATGLINFAASGAASTATVATSAIAAATAISVTASITDNLLVVTAVSTGTVVAGAILTGSGVATGTQVTEQLTPLLAGEATGGIGRYLVSIPEQTVASETIGGSYGVLTFGATVANGPFAIGDTLSGAGVTAGTVLWSTPTTQVSGGTAVVSPSQTATSTTITAALSIQTKWVAMSYGAPGELVKMSSWLLG